MTKVEKGRWHTEYGVFEDRRSHGLGFACVYTTSERAHAESKVAVLSDTGRYPMEIRWREVFLGEWKAPISALDGAAPSHQPD